MTDPISNAFDQATAKLKIVGDNIDLLPRSVGTFLMVHSAQGVIDNGGYCYFFEANWSNDLPYSKFVSAYFEIGCEEQSKDFARVVSTFPFEDPHINSVARNNFMDENYDEDENEVKGWGDALCGDEEVWSKLEAYYLNNKEDFV